MSAIKTSAITQTPMHKTYEPLQLMQTIKSTNNDEVTNSDLSNVMNRLKKENTQDLISIQSPMITINTNKSLLTHIVPK